MMKSQDCCFNVIERLQGIPASSDYRAVEKNSYTDLSFEISRKFQIERLEICNFF